MKSPALKHPKIGVIGLGYVGLPLAVAFAKRFEVVGLDINNARIEELRKGFDRTLEVTEEELTSASGLQATADPADLRGVDVYIVTTPTPIDEHKRPDLGPVLAATRTVAATLSPHNTVIYESTVYPGATEDECVPLLEEISGLAFNKDFFVGYSPERINPGDKEHRFETIVKVTSGSTAQTAQFVDELYRSVVTAGTHRASSIKVAEAAKVIENTQRDVNIALINELAVLFGRLEIDTLDVLEAAGTKWNFLPFRPGLVGGHCIGVDPYYLTHKAQSVGHHPEVILAGRRINDQMGAYAAELLIKAMLRAKIDLRDAKVLVLGLAFKENTPDLRNTKVIDVVRGLEQFGIAVEVFDPIVDRNEAFSEYGLDLVSKPKSAAYDAVVLAVPHDQFMSANCEIVTSSAKPQSSVIFDIKSRMPSGLADIRL